MEATEHQGKALKYLAIHPDGYDPGREYPLIVVLHGFGANMRDLAGLCPAIDTSGYVYICPNAPMPFQIGAGMVGYGWTPPRDGATPEDVTRAMEALGTTVEEVLDAYKIPEGRALLMGFSQGGSMTYRYGLPKPSTFAGLAVLSGGAPDPEELADRLPSERTQPIFIAHGVHDDVVSVGMARRAMKYLEAEGYRPKYTEYPITHEIAQPVMDDLVPWIKGVLPPAAAV